jgi:uncharacterized membrane protein
MAKFGVAASTATGAKLVSPARRVGWVFVFVWFFIGGMARFLATDIEVRLVPPNVPWPQTAVWISGALELLGAAGLLFSATRRAAGIGLFALTIAVTPVHVYCFNGLNSSRCRTGRCCFACRSKWRCWR